MAAPFMSTSATFLSGQPDPAFTSQFQRGTDLHNQGMALERQGKHAEAITALKNALEHKLTTIGPGGESTAFTYNGIAESQIQLGQLDEAEENIRKALEIVNRLNSTYNQAYYRDNLGLVYEMRGDLAEAGRIRFGATPDEYLCSYAKCQPQKLRPFNQMSQCSRCKGILYCSAECSKKDWKRHKKYCRKIE